MPERRRVIGSGMTQRVELAFDWDRPGDVDQQMAAAVRALDATSFARLSRRLATLVSDILDAAGLPHDIQGRYRLADDGSWEAVAPDTAADADILSLPQLLERRAVTLDSPEGYAVRALVLLHNAAALGAAAQTDEAMAAAFELGELVREAAIKAVWEPDARRGEKVLEGARSGHVQVHGTDAAKAARHATYVQAFEAACAGGMPRMTAYETVADHFDVSPRTVRRAVADAKKHG